MSRKSVLVIAGVLLAAGAVAAVSAPGFRRHGPMLGDRGDRYTLTSLRMGERLNALDANKDGAVTLDEFLARRTEAFARLDRNGDGAIDAAEFEAAARERADYWAKRFLKRFDADKDGKVTKDEYAAVPRRRFAERDLDLDDLSPGAREGRRERSKDAKDGRFSLDRLLGRADRRFSRRDRNGDGVIDAADFEIAATERVARASKRFFRRLDANGDAKVAQDEFSRRARERFTWLDLDDDGNITQADLPPQMRGRGFLK